MAFAILNFLLLTIPIVSMLVIQIPVMYIMSGFVAVNGIWLSFAVSDILGLLFASSIYFRKGQRDGKQDKNYSG